MAAALKVTVQAAVAEFAMTWVPLAVGRVQLTREIGTAGTTFTVEV